MSMQQKLWSINALSTELNMDRRTLAKKLASLPPAESKKVGEHWQKKWKLSDVVAHLNSLNHGHSNKEENLPPCNIYRILHLDTICHYTDYITEKVWPEWSKVMAEAGLEEELMKGIYKQHFLALLPVANNYLSQDIFNKYLKKNTGADFDEIFNLQHGCSMVTAPPANHEIPIGFPNIIKKCLTRKDLKVFKSEGVEI